MLPPGDPAQPHPHPVSCRQALPGRPLTPQVPGIGEAQSASYHSSPHLDQPDRWQPWSLGQGLGARTGVGQRGGARRSVRPSTWRSPSYERQVTDGRPRPRPRRLRSLFLDSGADRLLTGGPGRDHGISDPCSWTQEQTSY